MTHVFVNINGDPVDVKERPKEKRPTKTYDTGYHKGWRVKGIKPGELEIAEEQAEFEEKKFDRENWLMNAKRTPVRSKPYEIRSAAEVCAQLAEKAGWLGVQIDEVKKEVQS